MCSSIFWRSREPLPHDTSRVTTFYLAPSEVCSVNDANRYAIETVGDPRYPLDLFRRVITVRPYQKLCS